MLLLGIDVEIIEQAPPLGPFVGRALVGQGKAAAVLAVGGNGIEQAEGVEVCRHAIFGNAPGLVLPDLSALMSQLVPDLGQHLGRDPAADQEIRHFLNREPAEPWR